MKRIVYEIATEVRFGTEETPDIRQILSSKELLCSEENFEANYVVAQREAYGAITVEDTADPVAEPTQLDQIEAQVTYTALMTDTLLEEE